MKTYIWYSALTDSLIEWYKGPARGFEKFPHDLEILIGSKQKILKMELYYIGEL